MTTSEKESAHFVSLVLMFQAVAMQHMGKVKNPATDKIERDLEQAQFAIDSLDMIQAKTKGNLTQDEERLLKTVIQELKLNYVDELAKSAPQAEQEKESE
jgi:Na+-transporting methylmalonyl-CoA/oxaloacetate decarboxylase gamma subunit